MADHGIVVTQSSAVMDYASADHNNAGSNVSESENTGNPVVPDTSVSAEHLGTHTGIGDPVTSTSIVDSTRSSTVGADNITDLTQQDAPTVVTYDTNENVGGHLDASYATSINDTNNEARDVASTGITENGLPSDNIHDSATMHQPVDGSALSAEEERLWSIVRANSLDFGAWTALIEETEKMSEGNILKIRKVYDAFFTEFPLCYGYWKKYADHEARIGSMDKVVEVYERAVQGVTYSVDMWLHYCVFAINTYGDPETIRRLFERALAYVGTDYLSFPLWDKYLEYEYTQQAWSHVAAIYTRVLEIPNQQLDRYFEGFKELVASRPLSELRTAEEAAAAAAADSEASGEQVEGEIHPNSESSKPVSASLKDAEELEKYIAVREEIYKKAKEFDSKIIGFETAIRRPYFHVRPLNSAELENWHNFLDFIEGGGDFNKVVKLYERCLIACANYPEYWIRYVLCMEASGSMDLADNALARATQVFVKRQPEIHLFAARFREQHDDIPGARAAYHLVHTEISPGLLEATIKHANMEHRLGNLDDACTLYEQAIAIEKGKEHSQTLPLLYAQYSRFLYLVSGKVEKAREILDQAVENAQLSKPLLEAIIHLESIQPQPKRIEYLDSLVDKFIVPTIDTSTVASIDEREDLSSIFLEFLDLFGDAQSIKKADDRHAKLFLRNRTSSESKKRHAEDYLVSDKTKLSKAVAPAAAASVMGSYPGGQSQWPGGYSSQPQAWPQSTQTQAQQWNPAYTQQAAYGAYYGTGYTHPQAPTSVPPTAPYGAYPSTYPAQSYAQPAVAATLPPAQPAPAAVPPTAYYGGGSYY